ncbi:hypothetical protein NL676_005227 [Syzygium grande]|nr:hypothetical protein NL676_005227 [Syzygium grande]
MNRLAWVAVAACRYFGLFAGSLPEKLRALLKSWEVAVMSPWRPKRNRSSGGRGEMESSGWRSCDGRQKLPSSAGLSRRSRAPHMWQFSFCSLGLTLNISLPCRSGYTKEKDLETKINPQFLTYKYHTTL